MSLAVKQRQSQQLMVRICSRGDHSPVTAYRIIKDAYDDEDMTL